MSQKLAPHWSPEGLAEALLGLEVGVVRVREPLREHTRMRTGGPADVFLVPTDVNALGRTLKYLRAEKIPWMVLGSGSSLLIKDGGLPGVVLQLRRLDGYAELDASQGRVKVGSGLPVAQLVKRSLEAGFEGAWVLTGLKGTVGGAVRLNAGTRHGELQELVESLEIMTPSGEVKRAAREDLRFSYRQLDLPKDKIVVGATLRLGRGEVADLQARHLRVLAEQAEKEPQGLPTVGAIFRDPAKGQKGATRDAGRLIEDCGLRGVRVHGAQIAERSAGWIVNVGGARTGDILTLIRLIREKVKAEHGILLELQIKVVGREESEIPPLEGQGSSPAEVSAETAPGESEGVVTRASEARGAGRGQKKRNLARMLPGRQKVRA